MDTLEAGFPIASEGDFEAVDAVSRESHWVQVAAMARANTLDIDGRLALQRLLGGFGYEVTVLDVVDACTHFIAAADALGVAESARRDATALASQAKAERPDPLADALLRTIGVS